MIDLKKSWIKMQLRPRVIHRLPGRLRIHVPALKKVNPSFHDIANILLKGFQLPGSFEFIKVNYISANLLIVYDAKGISESKVLDWVFDVRNLIEEIIVKFSEVEEDKIQSSENKLYDFFKTESAKGTLIDRKFVIPNEIWN